MSTTPNRMHIESQQEVAMAAHLRQHVLRVIQERQLTKEQFADVLGLYPAGAGWLLKIPTWPLHTAVRAAEALGVDIPTVLAEMPKG